MSQAEAKNGATEQDIRKLVLARLAILSSDTALSIGDKGSFTRNELIEHVRAGDDVGQTIEKIEMEWLRAMKDGLVE